MEEVAGLIDDVVDRIWPSADEKLRNASTIAQLKALPAVQSMALRLQQASIASNLAASHNTFLSLGLALIYFSCGFCVFHDYVIAKILSDLGIHVSGITDAQMWQLIWLLVGGGSLHVVHTYLNKPSYPGIISQIKNIFKGG